MQKAYCIKERSLEFYSNRWNKRREQRTIKYVAFLRMINEHFSKRKGIIR